MENKTTSKTLEHPRAIKNIKHTFTPDERASIGGLLAQAIGTKRSVEAEFDQVKQSYKARISEQDSRICSISTDLVNGFDMRNEECVVVMRPDDKKKDYYLARDYYGPEALAMPLAVLTEDMTAEDFQTDLLRAESQFEKRVEIPIFPAVGDSSGIIVVGNIAGRWYSAIRIKVGRQSVTERLDSEQRSYKSRGDAIKRAAKRAIEWFKENFKEQAEGFQDNLSKAVEAEADKVE